jgi:hypothetical protein
VDEVRFDVRVSPVDGVLGASVEVVLGELVAVPADLQHVLDAGRDHHLDHVAGVLDGELGRVVPEQQRRRVQDADVRGLDVDRGLTQAVAAHAESGIDVGPVKRDDRRARVVIPRRRRRRPRRVGQQRPRRPSQAVCRSRRGCRARSLDQQLAPVQLTHDAYLPLY